MQSADVTTFAEPVGTSATLLAPQDAVMMEHTRPRASSTIARPASVQRTYNDRRHVYNRACVPTVTVTQQMHSAAPQNVIDADLGPAVHVQPPTRTVTSSTPLMAAPLPHVNPRVLSVPNLTITTPQNPAEVGLMKELRDLLRDPRSVSRVRDVVRRSRAPSAVSRGTKHTATPARAHSRRPSHAGLTPARSHRSAHSTRRQEASKARRASKHASKRRERSRSARASKKPSRHRSKRHSSQSTSDSEVSDSSDDSEVSLATPSPDRKRARFTS